MLGATQLSYRKRPTRREPRRFAAALLVSRSSVAAAAVRAGEELRRGEADALEHRTGVLGARNAAAHTAAVLLRQAEVVAGNKQLAVALKADDAKLSDGHIQALALAFHEQLVVKAAAHRRRGIAALTVTVTAAGVAAAAGSGLDHAGCQQDRRHRGHRWN